MTEEKKERLQSALSGVAKLSSSEESDISIPFERQFSMKLPRRSNTAAIGKSWQQIRQNKMEKIRRNRKNRIEKCIVMWALKRTGESVRRRKKLA
jgi:hypothetical protein